MTADSTSPQRSHRNYSRAIPYASHQRPTIGAARIRLRRSVAAPLSAHRFGEDQYTPAILTNAARSSRVPPWKITGRPLCVKITSRLENSMGTKRAWRTSSPGHFAASVPALAQAALVDGGDRGLHAGHEQQRGEAQAGQHGGQRLERVRRADGGGDRLHAQHRQDHPGQDPVGPGLARQGQGPDIAQQRGAFLGGRRACVHAHAARLAAMALPARLDPLRFRWPAIHWPMSTTASKSTPVSMSRRAHAATLPVAPLA